MAKSTTTYMVGDTQTDEALRPKHLSKMEFARNLHKRMTANGWNQSELARQAGITRDAVSTYMRALSFPDPRNARKLADAFGVSVAELLPNLVESAIDHDHPSMELKVSSVNPAKAWLRVNRLVTTATALEIMSLLGKDTVLSDDKD